ncbi:hypothetical protein Ndes2526B_g06054 [Nannochloris sp. 'desiccata']
MRVQGVLSLTEAHVDHLFGKLGTHSKCAGATLWLRDAFFADYRGRKVTILAPSRRVAACAIRTLLFQLSSKHGTDTALTTFSTWKYTDRKGKEHGPYPFHKMIHWSEQNAFHDESFPVQHSTLRCWIPLWCLPLLGDLVKNYNSNNTSNGCEPFNQPEEVAMEDWEMTVHQLNEERSKGFLHDTITTHPNKQGGAGGGGGGIGTATKQSDGISTTPAPLSDFPELQVYNTTDGEIDSSSAAPMDYELSHEIQFDVAPDGVRAFVVVDTNILLSHMSFTERIFGKLASSGPRVEVLLLVPWIVLNELDRLKDAGGGGGRGGRSDAARLALRRIRALTSDRDSFVHAQSAAEHEIAVAAGDLPNKATVQHRELRNDDLILQTCLHWHRGVVASLRSAGHRAAVFLLSNDKGLCTRAEANGVKCFAAMEFPGTVESLANQVPAVEPVSMEEAAAAAAVEKKVAEMVMKEHELEPKQAPNRHIVAPAALKAELPGPSSLPPPASQVPSPVKEEIQKHEPLHPTDPLHRLESIIERCLAPAIKYYRQQDLGDLWIEMLEERSRPPWRAGMVLDVLCSHSTTFWEYLTRKELEQARELERYLKREHQYYKHGHGHGHYRDGSSSSRLMKSLVTDDGMTAEIILQNILSKLLKGLEKPRQNGSDPPNPAEVPDFVSLGDAKGALQEGLGEIDQWLEEI